MLAQIASTPEYMLINIGANDVTALPTATQWKSYMREIYRTVHTKWPLCPIFDADTWRKNYDTESDTLATRRAELRAEPEFAPYVFRGVDERVFLKGSDDGATYTSDGLHPNGAGYLLTAQQWATALGY